MAQPLLYIGQPGRPDGRNKPGMKRFLITAAGLMFLCFALVFAAEKPPAVSPAPPRVPEMSAAGKAIVLSNTELRLERTLKGKVETMVFILENPFPTIKVGDQIKVSYREKDGRNILTRVTPVKKKDLEKSKKEALKKENPGDSKAVPVTK
jgi:hypothetical protein